ncbi:MAG: hypothetical protein DI586_00545 [Micavibrio aeruginosavorus]|uniref:Uncharacterized protein n=1 Tax=Micavibrio aeruginosavorus TaxID=349221 RepID=A0A2W5FR85_9BACT|nr:MAG: hypothetical protein DI586_00545 [Micavibrio aeruginosavorus]
MLLRLVSLFLFLFSFSAAYAAEKETETPLTKLEVASKKILDGLSENQTKQFAAIRHSHGVIRAVEDVRKNITKASESCSKHNPEFAVAMQKRVGEWQASIDPILKNAKERLDTMIKLQDFASPMETKSYLKKIDEAVAFKSKSMKSVPITEKKECKKLLGTMDDTDKDLKELLVQTLALDKPLEAK